MTPEEYADAEALVADLRRGRGLSIQESANAADLIERLLAEHGQAEVEWEYECKLESLNPGVETNWCPVSPEHKCPGTRRRRRKAGPWEVVGDGEIEVSAITPYWPDIKHANCRSWTSPLEVFPDVE